MTALQKRIRDHLGHGMPVWLFLDYDGTLADFAATPDIVTPDSQLIDLLERLIQRPDLRLAIISGRRLEHIRKLVPVPGLWLAGTYGLELQAPSGVQTEGLDYASVRPTLDIIKPVWEGIIGDATGFFLEDKGWTLAIHAKNAENELANQVLKSARRVAESQMNGTDFKIQGGHRFLEISPRLADKGLAVDRLLATDTRQDILPVYIGDDDKDIRAFPVVQARGGIALLVGRQHQAPDADDRLASPVEVRAWLSATFLY